MTSYIHGGSDEAEVKRLEKQATWGAPWMLRGFDLPAGARVLDLATGVGAMAGWLAEHHRGIRLCGVDLAMGQLRWARENHPSVPVARANGAALPFAAETFDRVHCSWLLEHVPAGVAVQILREVRRVLKAGGHCWFTEVDNSTFRAQPDPDGAIAAVMAALNAQQQKGGGDPYVGPKLRGFFEQAGFARVETRPLAIHGSNDDPVFFQGFIDEFAEIFESLDEALPALKAQAQRAATKLRALPGQNGTMDYSATTAVGFR